MNGTSTWVGQSLCSLGVTPGTYTWTWGTGSSADSLVLTIETPPPAPAPTVTSITPTSGPSTGGTNLKIAGTNFCGVTSITVGGVACGSFSVASPTSASCTTPAGAVGTASVVVTTPSGSNAANSLFTYKVPPPTVSAVSPQNGPVTGGTLITVTGTNFTGATAITVGGQACTGLNVTSATTATCTTSAGSAGASSVVVTTAGGSNILNKLFTYISACTAFNQTQSGVYACYVPPGTSSLSYTVIGAFGGHEGGGVPNPAQGGRGAKITGALAVTPGQTLYLTVCRPASGNVLGNGGGSGGGYSSISTTSATVGPVVVAGGGGGAGFRGKSANGNAGGHAGISTSPSGTGGGAGGAPLQPGLDGGQAAIGGAGGVGSSTYYNGGQGGTPSKPNPGVSDPGGSGGFGFGVPGVTAAFAYAGNGGSGYAGGGGGAAGVSFGADPSGGGGGGSSLIPAGATAVLAGYDEVPRVTLSGAVAPALTPSTQTVNGSVGSAITATSAPTPSDFNGAVTYSISPALPAGLALNASTGVISGTPTVAQSATNYTLTGTGATSGSATSTVSLSIDNGPALTPTFGTPTPTAGGYTVAITNYSGAYNWSTKTTAGTASINGSGLVTVTGLNPGGSATVTVFADRSDYYNGNATVSGTASVATTLSPSTQSISGTVGTAISPTQALSASGFSGAVSYAISPALPAGLSLNTSTGVVSGTPTAAQSATSYTLTGTGATSGSATTDLSVTVAQGAALNPSFGTPTPTANGYTVSISNYDANYTWAGSATAGGSVSISGSGLVTVSGLAPSASATTTVSVSRSGYGNGSGSVTGSASPPATALSPTTQTVSATQGLPLTPTSVLTPTGFSAAPSFTLSPSLPAGLSLNTVTGVISGTPSVTQAATVHTVTATGGSLTATSALNLTVSAMATPSLSPNPQALTGTPGSALTPSAAYTGATAATFSIQPPLPEGLSLNTDTGVISGTPTGFSPAGGALAAWYSNDFATSDLKQAAISGNASLTSGQIVLTPNSTNQQGAFSLLGDVGSGINAQAYKAEFTLNLSNPSSGSYGADGISYSFTDSPDLSNAALTQNAEVGVGPRLSVSFDSYGTSGPGQPGIRVLYGVKGNDPGTSGGSVLDYDPSMVWWGTGKKVRVEIDAQARLTLTLLDNPSVGNNTVIFSQLQLPADYLTADRSNWQHIFAARTVSVYSRQAIDDVTLSQSGPGAGQYTVTATNAAGRGTAAVSLAVGDLPAAPTNLAATSPGSGQATIGFTPPTGPGFGYQYSLDGITWLAANVINNAFTLTGLGSSNTIQLRAVNSAGPGPSASILFGTPSAPTALSATAGNGQASISFTPGADGGSPITSYEYSVDNGSNWTSTGSFSSPVKLTGLTNGTAYNVLLRGINALGNGSPSSAVSVTPVADPPGIPGDLTVSVSGNNATLSWDAPNNGGDTIIGYTVEIATSPPSYSPAPASCSGVVGATSCTITNLQSGTYFFRVKATNSRGSGGYTYTADGTDIPLLVPNAPTTLVATPASQQASIAFVAPTQTANGDPISNYPVMDYEYRIGAGAWISAGTTTSPVIIDGLTNGTGYTITLRAVNAAGAGTASSSVSVTPATAPGAPNITGATALTGGSLGQVAITFNAAANGGSTVTNYQYSVNGGAWTARSPASTSSPLTLTGLPKGTNAVIALRAVNGVGFGPADTVSVVPFGVPGSPTNATAVAADSKATVSWNPPSNSGGSRIIDYTVTSSTGSRTCTTFTTSCTVIGLTNGTAYTFTVKARNTHGSSAASDPSASVTPGAVPSAPQSVQATAGNAQASVQWIVPNGNTPATTSYTVVADQDASKTCTTSALTCNVTGLTNGTAYSFSVKATNSLGTGPAGSTSGTVTPKTVPGAPLAVSASPGNAAVTVSWSAPDSNGGSAITGYTVTGSPSGGCTITGSSCTVTGLTNGTDYSFTVTATNSAGTSIGSSSVSATPIAPALLPATQSVNGIVGTALSVTAVLTPNNSFGGTVTYSVPSLPSGLSLNPSTGVISGTPSAEQAATSYIITGTSGANSATTTATIGITLAKQSPLSVSAGSSSILVNGTTLLSSSGGDGGGAVSYAVASGPCSISNTNTLTGTGVGSCSITATKAATSTYAEITSSPITVSVALNPQTALVASASPTTINVNATSTLSTSGGNGGGAVIYEVVSGPCGVVGTTLTGTGAGSCSVTATKAADSTYAAVTSSPVTVTVQLNAQTPLVAIANAININVNGTSQLSTAGGSGTGAVSYAVAGGDPCSIAGNILTGTGTGSCTVTATKAADTVYASATSSTVSITVNRNPQTALVAVAGPTSINVNGTSALSTTGGSGTGAVTFAKVSGPCNVSGSSLSGTGAGTCLFTASKAQDASYSEATSLPVSVIVGLSPQSTLSVAADPTTFKTGESSQLSATGGSGTGAVTYASLSGPCTLSGNTLSSQYAGSCAVTATKAADGTYAEAVSLPMTVTVGLSPQSALTAVASPSTIQVNGTSVLSTTGGTGTGEVFYNVVSGPCQMIGNSLTGTGAGSCSVTATKQGDQGYSQIISSPIIVTVGLAPQSALGLVANPTTINLGDTSELSSTGGSGTGIVSYTLVDGPCSLDGSTVTGKEAGTCNLTATKAADESYAEATSSAVALTVGLAPQSPLSVLASPSTINVGDTSQLSVGGGSGSGAVTYSLVSGPCSLSGSVLSGIGTGNCVVTANKAADDRYASVNSSPLTVTVGLAPQSALSGLANPSALQVYGTATLATTGGSGTGAVTYSLVSGPCSVSGSTLAGLSEGSCTLTATQAEDATYAAVTSAPFTVAVGLAPQSALGLVASPSAIKVDGLSELTGSGGSGSGELSYQLVSGPCALSGSTLTGLDAGSCVVTATRAAAEGYAAATSDPVTVAVGLAAQTPLILNFTATAQSSWMASLMSALTNATPLTLNVNGTALLSVEGGAGTGAVTYQVISGPCSVAGNILTGLGAGTCAVVATKAADELYAEQISAPMQVIVGLNPQSTLDVSASPDIIALGGISTLGNGGGDGNGTVTYNLLSGPCSLDGNSLSGIGVGSCVVTATKAAADGYAATTSAPFTITVGLLAQSTLTLAADPATIPATGTTELSVNGGDGAGWVTYTVLGGPCSVLGSQLTGIEGGSCSVMAAKAADSTYAATTTSPITVTVIPAPIITPTLSPATQTLTGRVGTAISPSTALTATGFGGVVSYGISPALPAGLSLDPVSGIISGTPRTTQAATSYVITGTGETSGTATAVVSLAITAAPPLPNSIPTLGEWAKIVMMLMMIATVRVVSRRKLPR